MSEEKFDLWPFYRDEPDKVVLPPLVGAVPSKAPPVRIFLGTEESQYRAERVFFYSILQVRDPGRTYEIYLMKNLAGFDRRGWRTGFTNYRYAIPTLAGGSGKAIYNDVDQIYLADPALLFDLSLEGHGYLAIADTDTSVMLIDCAKMLPLWNREAASHGSKGELLNKPRKEGGLWGQLDPHWNARDQEYDERLTKCLHYTALHQQPWEPFPEAYSYHANPLAYIWHDLERRADREGYQVFTVDSPSPGYDRQVGANSSNLFPIDRARVPNEKASALFTALSCQTVEEIRAIADAGHSRASLFGLAISNRRTLKQGPSTWPDAHPDIIAVFDLFEVVPPADTPWILDLLFRRAAKALYIAIRTSPGNGMGSAVWWRRRIAEAAQAHPGKSWHFDAITPDLGVEPSGVERHVSSSASRVWVLTAGERSEDEQAVALARKLAIPFETKDLVFGPLGVLPHAVRGASRIGLDVGQSARIEEPWPDLVISGRRTAAIGRWIKRQSKGRTRLVQIGGPGSAFSAFDLIIALPEEQLPIRDNVLQVAAPLLEPEKPEGNSGSVPQEPVLAVFVTGGRYPFAMPRDVAINIAKAAANEVGGKGAIWLCAVGSAAASTAEAMADAIKGTKRVIHLSESGDNRLAEILSGADGFVVTVDDRALLARVTATNKPIAIADLPLWYDKLKVVRPVLGLMKKATGGGLSYRGTPHQQHVVGRFLDRLTAQGLRRPSSEPLATRRALIARGLAVPLGGQAVSSAKRLDDLDRVSERVRRLLTDYSTTA
ncbi:hypothetical protein SAMN07250955_104265 [Arboricoccus pini]|uniref:Uncharacterized protein n=1 Tax=Arboricoccus pini TaxID=1963835 RepID=A0A212R0V6_9PROT|nr:ELM1/GtrOC1 family putative glycosyltransferase [Arboricoccus pini]SNB65437.1 hypothetical protein SAMN07250955_104265 [Arboricoccus pini]